MIYSSFDRRFLSALSANKKCILLFVEPTKRRYSDAICSLLDKEHISYHQLTTINAATVFIKKQFIGNPFSVILNLLISSFRVFLCFVRSFFHAVLDFLVIYIFYLKVPLHATFYQLLSLISSIYVDLKYDFIKSVLANYVIDTCEADPLIIMVDNESYLNFVDFRGHQSLLYIRRQKFVALGYTISSKIIPPICTSLGRLPAKLILKYNLRSHKGVLFSELDSRPLIYPFMIGNSIFSSNHASRNLYTHARNFTYYVFDSHEKLKQYILAIAPSADRNNFFVSALDCESHNRHELPKPILLSSDYKIVVNFPKFYVDREPTLSPYTYEQIVSKALDDLSSLRENIVICPHPNNQKNGFIHNKLIHKTNISSLPYSPTLLKNSDVYVTGLSTTIADAISQDIQCIAWDIYGDDFLDEFKFQIQSNNLFILWHHVFARLKELLK